MQATARARELDHVNAREVVSRLKGARRCGKGWVALCPAHDDHAPSLSINEGSEGRVLLKCLAGCSFSAVCTAVGVDPRSLGPDATTRPATKRLPRIIATYPYVDEDRKLLFETLRYDPKGFKQCRPNGRGGRLWNLANVRRVLYHLPDILLSDPSTRVFIVEGEKDVDKLTELGLVATTNACGAGKWRDEYNETLRRRHVVILPDNDETGRKHAAQVATSLLGIAASIKIVELPGLPLKGDVSDWLGLGNEIKELHALVDATSLFECVPDGHLNRTASYSEEEELQRLSALSPLEYDRERKDTAKALNCRPETLDKLVKALRPTHEGGLQGRGIDLGTIEPWPEPVNGAEVLNEVAEAISRYLALGPGEADVLAIWSAHAHAFEAFDFSPRLNFSSPEKGCGKTTGRDVVGLFVPRPLATENLSVAVLFRVIESQKPTLLADECDAWVNDNEELRGLINAGHRRGGQALRCEGESNEVRAFNVFGPAALCGIGSLPGTLSDRSIVIRLKRARPGELRQRFDSRHTEREQELARKLARFAGDNFTA